MRTRSGSAHTVRGAAHGCGDRVVVQVEAHVRGLARRHRAQLVGRERRLGPREQALALGRKGLGHRHRGVLGAAPRAGDALAPGLGLRVQVVQIGEGASGEEGLAHVADRALDAPFSLPRATATGRGSKR